MKLKILNIIILFQFFLPGILFAVGPAPDITDREVVEKLAKLESGQQALNQRFSDTNQRISDLRSEMQAGQESLRSEMKAGQEAISKRLDDMNKRLGDINKTMLTLFGAIITLIVAIFAYIAWDRRTMLRPVAERLDRFEKDVALELGLNSSKGSKIDRLINALRELAKTDEKVATVLRSFSLL